MSLPGSPRRSSVAASLFMSSCVAATGTGKSTCVPLFLLRDAWRSNSQIRIIVTQPRRVAAVSLAQRVASFLPPGYNEVGQVVGYRVGGNREDAGARGRKQSILFTTTAYLRSLLVHRVSSSNSFSNKCHVSCLVMTSSFLIMVKLNKTNRKKHVSTMA